MSERHASQVTQHMQLMRSMGAPSFDPIPPDQYLFPLECNITLNEREQLLWSWLLSKTISGANRRKRSPWAKDRRGDLTLTHVAKDLEWSLPAASKVCSDLEEKGLCKRDEDGRLYPCGTVPKQEGGTKSEVAKKVFRTDNLPEGLRLHLEQLPKIERDNALRRLEVVHYYGEQLKADAILAARRTHEQAQEQVYREIGYRDEETRGRKPEQRELLVKLEPASDFHSYFVQISARLSVQNGNSHSDEIQNGVVQNGPPIADFSDSDLCGVSEENSDRSTSEEEKVAATPRSEPTLTPPPTPLQKTSGDGVNAHTDAPVVRAAEESMVLLGHERRKLNPSDPLYTKFEALSLEHKIPKASVIAAMEELVAKKNKQKYPVDTIGALFKFLNDGLPAWIRDNWQLIERHRRAAREEKRAADQAAGERPVFTSRVDTEELIEKLSTEKAFGAGKGTS